ncbi:MAG: integrase arm-type DNA-binding domain-containing protein [Sphingomonas sp.]
MKSNQLTAIKLRTKTPGRYTDGGGLILLVKPTGARSWVLRIMVDGVRRDVGLGSVDTERFRGPATEVIEAVPIGRRTMLTLAEARQKAAEGRRLLRAGLDPVEEWKKDKVVVPTFERKATAYWEANKASWRNDKHRETWLASLKTYAFPTLGEKGVDIIDASDIARALAPIWLDKPETADRVQQRICSVLRAARITKGERREAVPVAKEIQEALPRRTETNSRQEEHFAAMDYRDLPTLISSVRRAPVTVARLALLFVFYTCARTGEVRGMKWSEIDLEGRRWVVPGDRMKKGRAHVVPLSEPAVAILREIGRLFGMKAGAIVFPGAKRTSMSDATIAKAFKLAGGSGFTVHGSVRSGFRDWCGETQPLVPGAVAESVLAHKVKDKTERAYHRTAYFDQRRPLMGIWAEYLLGAG